MLDGTAVDRIAELAREGQDAGTLVREIEIEDGVSRVFTTRPLHHLPAKYESEPAPLAFSSLQALVEYLKANRDGLDLEKLVLHVASPTSVSLLGPITGEAKQRFVYATATCKNLVAGWLGQFHPQLDFVIALQARFEPYADRGKVLEISGSLKEEASVESTDDGITQRVAARTGVHLGRMVEVPNPVNLAPYRTFREVAQPISEFVLRVDKGARPLALFEADGGSWELDAVRSVATWLQAQQGPVAVPVLR